MIEIGGLYWPDDVGETWRHAILHLRSVEWAIARTPRHRVALQAGGNIGLWPRRLAEIFETVITFEPDPGSMDCLLANVPANVRPYSMALGAESGHCNIKHRGLGSHRIVDGDEITMTTIDSFELDDLDYLQLDVEGYELNALKGAQETIRRCHPLIQIELRGFTTKYGTTKQETVDWLTDLGYVAVSQQPGSDVVFRWRLA